MNIQESKKIEKKILEILNKTSCLKKTSIIIGVSGGPDSIFLLNILANLPSLKIVVAHVNHCLRGKNSEKDEKFVENFTKNLKTKIPAIFELKKIDINSLSKSQKKGLEETGRKVRYNFFKSLAKKYKARIIITAHNADDNAETIILNFIRGASLKGLSGMQEMDPQTNLFRPILSLSKKTIIDYLKFKKIKFQTDKTNFETEYNRNFIRHEIIPQLKKINPNITGTLAKNSQNLREINDFLIEEALVWIKKNLTSKSARSLNLKNFNQLHIALKKAIIIEFYKIHAGDIQNIENKHIEEILTLINKNVGNKQKKFGKIIFYLKNKKLFS